MRTIVHAAFLAGLFLPGAAYAADLDYPYEPAPPVAAVPPPPVVAVLPPRCGFYRPCVRPWRFGFWRRPWRFAYAGPRPYPVGPRPYAVAPPVEGYPRERFDRYGYGAPRPEGPRGYGREGYGPRDGYGPRERYGERRPYSDPLGHEGERRRGERFDRYGDDGRGGGRFDRAPGDEPGPGRGYRGEPG